MKRSWFGLFLLVALLLTALPVTRFMDRTHEGIAQSLTQASDAAIREDWTQAGAAWAEAVALWHRHSALRAVFADHGPMEDIEAALAQSGVYLRLRDPVPFAAACADTARQVQAMGQAHALKWENFF